MSFVRLLEGQCCEHQRAAMCMDPDMQGEWWRCEICETAGVCHQGRWTHPADPSSFLAFVYDRCCRLPPAMLQSLERGALLSSRSAANARARGGAAAASGGGGAHRNCRIDQSPPLDQCPPQKRHVLLLLLPLLLLSRAVFRPRRLPDGGLSQPVRRWPHSGGAGRAGCPCHDDRDG